MKRKVNIEFFGKKINFSIRNVIRIVWISGVITFTARMWYSYQSRNVDEVVLDSDENVSKCRYIESSRIRYICNT